MLANIARTSSCICFWFLLVLFCKSMQAAQSVTAMKMNVERDIA